MKLLYLIIFCTIGFVVYDKMADKECKTAPRICEYNKIIKNWGSYSNTEKLDLCGGETTEFRIFRNDPRCTGCGIFNCSVFK